MLIEKTAKSIKGVKTARWNMVRNKIKVNSAHHQSVYEVGKDLTVSAKASDGIIEGIEHKKMPIFSVQYHPEASPGPQDSDYLFDKFVKLMKVKN